MKCFNSVLLLPALLALMWIGARASGDPALTLPDVLARHAQALGGLGALALPQTQRTVGTLEVGGLRGAYVSVFRAPDHIWSEQKLGLLDDTSGTDGRISWQHDTNGNVRLLSEEELRSQRNGLYLDTYSYLFPDRLPGKVLLRPATERRTGDYVLDIAPEGGKPFTLFLDPKSFLIVREQHAQDDRTVTTAFSDYKPMAGVMTASVERTGTGERKYDAVMTLSDITDAVDAADTLFALPQIDKNYVWSKPGATSVTLPFDFADHWPNLLVGLNDQAANIVLDSGAGGLTLDKRAADILKLKPEGTLEARGYGGSADEYPVRIDALDLGRQLTFHAVSAAAIKMPDSFAIGAVAPAVGFVGYDLLSRFVVKLDYARRSITLTEPGAWTPGPEDGQELPLELDDNVPSVLAKLDGLPPARFLIDTGDAASFVKIYGPYAVANKLTSQYAKGVERAGSGVGGESPARRARVRAFTLAGITVQDIPVDFSLDARGGASKLLAGAIGSDFLARFTVTFDFPHRRAFFAPNADVNQPFLTRTFGVDVVELPDAHRKNVNHVIIVGVDSKSPAYRAMLDAGSELLKIDGKSATDMGLAEVRRLLSPEGGQSSHELSVAGPRGGIGTVKVTEYDPLPPSGENKS